VRDQYRQLVGLLRYRPWRTQAQPKMVAAPGSRRRLLPHPAIETSEQILLVEGEPDMIAARSRGVPAIAVPGAESWRTEWAPLFAGREITIVMDCDRDGRRAAARITQDLCGYADVMNFDLTDLFRDHPLLAREVLR
jgi:DNA primase